MTGRELVLYILANNLEDDTVSFMTMSAAVKFHVGIETIRAWVSLGQLDSIQINGEIYIPEKAVVKEV